jgi:hypothetical protein
MGHLLGIVLPLAIGAALTPTIVAVQLVTLSGREAPVRRAWALALGCAVVLVLESALAFALAASTGASHSPSRAGAIVKLVAAALLVVIGIRALRSAPRPTKPATDAVAQRPRLGRSLAIGAGLMATNFSSLVLYFPAVHAIGISDAGTTDQVVAFLLLFVLTLLPAIGPPAAVMALGPRATRPLDALSRMFTEHRRGISATVCFGFAALLIVVGLRALT